MIKVDYKPGRIIIDGHSNYAPKGQDIVCAGASILTYTLLSALDFLGDKLTVELTDGHTDMVWPVGRKQNDISDAIFGGFKLLAGKYPHYISVNRVG